MRRPFAAAFAALAAAVLIAAGGPAAAEPRFALPIDCDPGVTCWIQNYVDQDPGPGRADHTCGQLSYDGHKGTDFRIADIPAMEKGVPVLAAAAGTVRAIRDGMDDVSIRVIGREALQGRDAGNSVVVVHGDGWETQYAHLKRGSVRVKPGETVEAGQVLGLVGLSGFTEFPHVHFEARKDGTPVDPFVGTDDPPGCEGPRNPLWTAEAEQRLAYRPTAGLVMGFAASPPKADEARAGTLAGPDLPRDGAALLLWADVMGAHAGDEQRFRVTGPDGGTVIDHRDTLKDSRVAWFAFAGRKTPPGGWPAGTYTGRYTLMRNGTAVVEMRRDVTVR
ncbi:M23 family metallopeptidase [Azospirillum halopraeferens]|uniref:M23 family metallopeptidase n=1 Tax=Azospirillum halopraeferens TaxID=34010 RepID=UPI00042008C4|nr:M23 family metallopeptidase [Azospirillum halopraeferens]